MKLFDAMLLLDEKIIVGLEKFCHKTQRLFGWTNFTWIRALALPVGLATFLHGLDSIHRLGTMSDGSFFIAMGVILMIGIHAACTVQEKKRDREQRRGFMNELRGPDGLVAGIMIKFIFLFFSLLSFGLTPVAENETGLLNLQVFILCWIVIMYFFACDPLPPSESKLKQWLKSLLPKSRFALSR